MKLTIVRSFSKTKRTSDSLKLNSFCSVSAEYEALVMPDDQFIEIISEDLDRLIQHEVKRPLE
jgi:hypothetical protein